ncbi:oligosaccharide flippase family protein [Microbulbifer mangrovi]|uniref:oligosaccharide flippase family protein n=1 Tax=Microbulbifer mangrovi TaxID=927787 RepID=UPI000990764D|nr:oligosaccharide flippase family protein [Microbulbifer mangrovi]
MIALAFRKLRQCELLLTSGVSLFVRGAAAFSAFGVSVVIGRQLGAIESGYYFLAFSVITFFAAISRVGLDNTVLRYVGAAFSERSWSVVKSVAARSLAVAALVSSVVMLLLYAFADFLSVKLFGKPELASVLIGMAPGVIGVALFTLLAMVFQGLHKVVLSVFILNISTNIFLVLGIALLDISNAFQMAFAFSIAALLTALFGGFVLWMMAGGVSFQKKCSEHGAEKVQSFVNWLPLFQSCMPLWVVVIMQQLVQWSGQFVAGAYVDSEALAQLAAAQRTAMLTSFILMAVNLVLAPRFAALYKQRKMVELRKLSMMSVRLMIFFSFPLVVVMLGFPELFMRLFGEGFSEGAYLLQILVIGQFINVATGSVGYLLSMSGHETDLRNTVLVSGPIALVLAFALTPVWGATGSAVATAVAVGTQNLLAVWQVKRRLGFNTLVFWRN